MLKAGDRFGDYTVEKLLGQGGMGAVYLLCGPEGAEVAAKILDPASSGDHESRKRFLREAELALGVKHPNLVETYDVGEDPDTGLCYILMEYVPGGSLADRLKAGPLPINDAIRIVYQIASVLELAREKGIVHRDIKPANIMFGADGQAKLADLGIARSGVGGTETTVTQTGMMIGTPAYMAPEQILDSHAVDCRADLYALGVVLYEMLAGSRPYVSDNAVELLAKKMRGIPPADIRQFRPETPSALAELVAALCAPQRENRPSLPSEVLQRISEMDLRPKKESSATETSGVPLRPYFRGRARGSLGFWFSLLLAVGTSALTYWGLESETKHSSRPAWTRPAFWQERVAAVERRLSARAQTVVKNEVVPADETEDDVRPVLKTDIPPPVDRRAQVIRIDPLVIRSEEGVDRSSVERLAAALREALPRNKAIFGDPYAAGLKTEAFVVAVSCRSNHFGTARYRLTTSDCRIVTGRTGGFSVGNLADLLCAAALYVAPEPNWEDLAAYAQGRKQGDFAPLDELNRRHPSLMRDYFALKLKRGRENRLYGRVTVEQEVELFSEVVGRDVQEVFARSGWQTGKR